MNNGMIDLTDTAALLWRKLDKAKNLNSITEAVMEEYEVDYKTANRDVIGFVKELYDREMVFDVIEFRK